jgi:acyl carrier protein
MKEVLANPQPTTIEIQDWLIAYLSELLDVEPEAIDVKVSFDRYGLDSAAAVGMTGALEDWLEYELDPTLIYDYPTIATLAANLQQESKAKM